MGMPKINVLFQTRAQTFQRRSQRGIVAVILRDALETEPLTLLSVSDIPERLAASNQAYLKRAFIGGSNPPSKVLVYVLDPEGGDDLEEALAWLAKQHVNYLAGPPEITAAECAAVSDWVRTQRTSHQNILKVVLPHTAADYEGVINLDTDGIRVAGATYDAAAYCSRVAGALAGTALTESSTYLELPEVEDVARLTESEMDGAVDAGKLIFWHDGYSVRLGRAVNSLVNVGDTQSDAWKKIKILDTIDMMREDLRLLLLTNWVGKYNNSYDNRILLLTAVREYFSVLALQGILQPDYVVDFDVEAISKFLQKQGTDVEGMDDVALRQAELGTHVFLIGDIHIYDAIEDIHLPVNI